MLTLTAITHTYGGAPVLHDVSFQVAPGRVISLAGPSRCGKTTLLHIAAGLLTPRAGSVQNGFQRTALVFQEPRLLPWRTTLDNLAFGLKAQHTGGATRRERAEALATRLGLRNALAHYPHQLSGGMRQHTALGRALAIEPDLLLLDEPFSALDIGLRRELHDLLLELIVERGLAALCITHDLTEAVRLGDELVVLSPAPGRVVYHWQQTRPLGQRDAAYGIDPARDLTLQYTASAVDALQLLLAGQVDTALLGEPSATGAQLQGKQKGVDVRRALNLQEEWGKAMSRAPRIPQAGTRRSASSH